MGLRIMGDSDGVEFELYRLPGLFRRWELAEVLRPGTDYHVEDAGQTRDGTYLIAVYRREAVIPGDPA